MTDVDVLEAKVRYLDAQLRLARSSLLDAYAQAALGGLLAGLSGRCELATLKEQRTVVDAAFRCAEIALVRREQIPPFSQPTER